MASRLSALVAITLLLLNFIAPAAAGGAPSRSPVAAATAAGLGLGLQRGFVVSAAPPPPATEGALPQKWDTAAAAALEEEVPFDEEDDWLSTATLGLQRSMVLTRKTEAAAAPSANAVLV
eukprot:TRINITY_DN38031_c1_g1_i1.p3 TRINITY_DN38031_c1_g1~~TRINITY_DN38031_c1_g1_i1.p3  ORF type:complete len:120 (+),score=31.05 TRINITY_DN38031_c1_g1_i1:113-472(+)